MNDRRRCADESRRFMVEGRQSLKTFDDSRMLDANVAPLRRHTAKIQATVDNDDCRHETCAMKVKCTPFGR